MQRMAIVRGVTVVVLALAAVPGVASAHEDVIDVQTPACGLPQHVVFQPARSVYPARRWVRNSWTNNRYAWSRSYDWRARSSFRTPERQTCVIVRTR